MRFDNEVVESFGGAGVFERWFEVVVFDPHGDPDWTCIGLDTPDGRRHELDAEGAASLAHALQRAAQALPTIKTRLEAEQMRRIAEEDEDDLSL